MQPRNLDREVVESFGQEWRKFDHLTLPENELRRIFEEYFFIFPWKDLPENAVGFDLGCGTGRWARFVAPRVGELHCIDPSEALEVARRNLAAFANCRFHQAGVDNMPLPDASADFGYSLGVLHHLPDTQAALADCARKLKPGAPLLIYLYYAFDNRPWWFRTAWKISDLGRWVIAAFPFWLKALTTELIAATVYWPLARAARLLERHGGSPAKIPLSEYRNRTYYTMRNDALDRFGTRRERRFTREEIGRMMNQAGLEDVRFGERPPFWCALGRRRS